MKPITIKDFETYREAYLISKEIESAALLESDKEQSRIGGLFAVFDAPYKSPFSEGESPIDIANAFAAHVKQHPNYKSLYYEGDSIASLLAYYPDQGLDLVRRLNKK